MIITCDVSKAVNAEIAEESGVGRRSHERILQLISTSTLTAIIIRNLRKVITREFLGLGNGVVTIEYTQQSRIAS